MGRDARDRRRHAGGGLATPWRSRLHPAALDWAIGHASLARDLQTLAAYRFIDHIGSASVPALPNTSPHRPLSQVSAGATCPSRRMGAGVISAVINPPTTLSAGVDNRTAQTILRRTPSYRQANILIGQRGRTNPRHALLHDCLRTIATLGATWKSFKFGTARRFQEDEEICYEI